MFCIDFRDFINDTLLFVYKSPEQETPVLNILKYWRRATRPK
jgi:hypothetical protein